MSWLAANASSLRSSWFDRRTRRVLIFVGFSNSTLPRSGCCRCVATAHLQVTDTLPYGATTRAAAIIATVKELTGRGMSLATLHRSCHLPLWHPGSKLLEPAICALNFLSTIAYRSVARDSSVRDCASRSDSRIFRSECTPSWM